MGQGNGAQTSEDSAAWTLLGVTDIKIYIFVNDIRIFIFLTIKLPFITLYCDLFLKTTHYGRENIFHCG